MQEKSQHPVFVCDYQLFPSPNSRIPIDYISRPFAEYLLLHVHIVHGPETSQSRVKFADHHLISTIWAQLAACRPLFYRLVDSEREVVTTPTEQSRRMVWQTSPYFSRVFIYCQWFSLWLSTSRSPRVVKSDGRLLVARWCQMENELHRKQQVGQGGPIKVPIEFGKLGTWRTYHCHCRNLVVTGKLRRSQTFNQLRRPNSGKSWGCNFPIFPTSSCGPRNRVSHNKGKEPSYMKKQGDLPQSTWVMLTLY